MPPTKATVVVHHTHLVMQPPQLRRLQPGRPAIERAKHFQRSPSTASQAFSRGSVAIEPKPSTSTCTATPRRAAAQSASVIARPASSSWKM